MGSLGPQLLRIFNSENGRNVQRSATRRKPDVTTCVFVGAFLHENAPQPIYFTADFVECSMGFPMNTVTARYDHLLRIYSPLKTLEKAPLVLDALLKRIFQTN